MIKCYAAALFVAIAAPAMAQGDPPAVPTGAVAIPSPTVPVDPAKLELARAIIAKTMPPGRLRETMDGMMGPLTDRMMGQIRDMPIGRMLEAFGVPAERARKVTMANVMQIASILDPAYQRRQEISMKVMMTGILDITSSVEPDVLDATAKAYARNFDMAELKDIDRFFSTPSGETYARNLTKLASDPGVLDAAAKMMPKMMEAMPDIIKKVQAATASLPKPRDPETLTDAERDKIARLMGVDPAELKKKTAARAKP